MDGEHPADGEVLVLFVQANDEELRTLAYAEVVAAGTTPESDAAAEENDGEEEDNQAPLVFGSEPEHPESGALSVWIDILSCDKICWTRKNYQRMTSEQSKWRSMVGKAHCMAPECVNKDTYGTKADIWCLDVAVIEMLQGEPPYSKEIPLKALDLIAKRGILKLENPEQLSAVFQDFVTCCLQTDEDARQFAEQLLRV